MSTVDRRIRWESIRRQQFSFTNNLFLTIGIATCGYFFDRLLEHQLIVNGWLACGCGAILISVTFGIWLTVNRLLDYRATVEKIISQAAGDKTTMQASKIDAKVYGKWSWCLLWLQIATTCLAFGLFIIYLFNHEST